MLITIGLKVIRRYSMLFLLGEYTSPWHTFNSPFDTFERHIAFTSGCTHFASFLFSPEMMTWVLCALLAAQFATQPYLTRLAKCAMRC